MEEQRTSVADESQAESERAPEAAEAPAPEAPEAGCSEVHLAVLVVGTRIGLEQQLQRASLHRDGRPSGPAHHARETAGRRSGRPAVE